VLQLDVELQGADDARLFAGVRKISGGANVPFEGSYGFGYDFVTSGYLRVSLRKQDDEKSEPWRPVHPFDESQPLAPGDIVPVRIELLPSSTSFKAGDELQLDLRGRWFFPMRNPVVLGPQYYESSERCTIVAHLGSAHLLVPIVPCAV
jgi:uncharacterized protein